MGVRKPLCRNFVLLVLACASTSACRQRPGPLELQLQGVDADFRSLSSHSNPSDRKPLLAFPRRLAPLLSEKDYIDPTDVARRDLIMFRASVLMSAVLARLAESEADPAVRGKRTDASRQLFMNAYLLDSSKALSELKPLLPAGADLSAYDKVRIPEYQTLRQHTDGNRVQAETSVREALEYYLLQMVCGDILRKAKAVHPRMHALEVHIHRDGQMIATGHWDAEKDEILLKLR